MKDIDTVRKRMKKRKETYKPLNDKNFKNIYNIMIKAMVALLIGLSIITYTKLNPNTSIKEYVLNDDYFNVVTNWISDVMFGFLPSDKEDLPVHSEVSYTHIEKEYYKNTTNEVINFEAGKVIYVGTSEEENYVVVLFKNDVQVMYSNIEEIFVSLYDNVGMGEVLGTYSEKLILKFEYLGNEISYETYLGMG
jgi:hypothetical protein